MNSIAKHLARELDVATSTHVTRVNRSAGSWQLFADDRLLGHFDWLISSAPSPQTCALLADQAIAERTVASMTGCWATMIEFGSRVPVDFDAAFVNDSPLAWIARNNSKPSRDEHECWVLHGTSDWSQQHIESEPAEVEHYFYAALAEATSCELPASIHRAAHRWRYALPVAPLAEQAIFDFDHCLATCGDWCGGPRVEGAWQSGRRVGTQLAKFFG
jgi:predicted NAD/FAD-dependent oxidoreductase